jgi:D-alanine transaminase
MPELAYVNGVFSAIADAKVSIEDRGFQFGDGIYEVVAAYSGRPFLLDRHMLRFRQSATTIGLTYDFEARPLEPIVMEGLRRSELADAMVYMQITRGVAPRSHLIPPNLTPTVVMTFKPLPTVPEELRQRGARLVTTPEIRWAQCSVKAITLLPNTLARSDAVRRGYDDALFVARGGEVREATAANIFLVKDGRLLFPPRNTSILHGVTLGFLLECASSLGIAAEERVCDLKTLRSAHEVFLSATTIEVLGVCSIDDRPIGDGTVGPVTRKLHGEFRLRARSQPD